MSDWSRHRAEGQSAERKIRFFYLLCLLVPLEVIWNLGGFLNAKVSAPLWPLVWAEGIPIRWVMGGLSLLLILSALTAARSLRFCARAAVSLTLFLSFALESSQGKILHSGHLCLWISFLLLWLPAPGTRHARGLQARLVLAWATALVFLVYSTAGLTKLAASLLRWPGWFNCSAVSEAMALHALKGGVVAVPVFPASWVPGLTAGYFVCLVPALFSALIPGGAIVAMIGLVSFHLLSAGLMDIYFPVNTLILILFGSSRDPLNLLRRGMHGWYVKHLRLASAGPKPSPPCVWEK